MVVNALTLYTTYEQVLQHFPDIELLQQNISFSILIKLVFIVFLFFRHGNHLACCICRYGSISVGHAEWNEVDASIAALRTNYLESHDIILFLADKIIETFNCTG